MEIRNTNALVPVRGVYQFPAGLEKQERDIDRFKGFQTGRDRIVFIGYKPRNNENTYSPHGKIRANGVATGEIVDIYI